MKNNTISIYCKTYIDVFKVNEIIGTNYDKKNKKFAIYCHGYYFEYNLYDFNDEKDFINMINYVNRAIKGYEEEKYVQEVC